MGTCCSKDSANALAEPLLSSGNAMELNSAGSDRSAPRDSSSSWSGGVRARFAASKYEMLLMSAARRRKVPRSPRAMVLNQDATIGASQHLTCGETERRFTSTR